MLMQVQRFRCAVCPCASMCDHGTGSCELRLRSLTFGFEFNQTLAHTILPPHLRHLSFGDRFNQSLDSTMLPIHLRTLAFGDRFNQRLNQVLWPQDLEKLIFRRDFNQPLDGLANLPNLGTLMLGQKFNQVLPAADSPAVLSGSEPAQEQSTSLFPRLHTLVLGDSFSHSLEHHLSSLKSLSLGRQNPSAYADVPSAAHLSRSLPLNLEDLTVGGLAPESFMVFPSALQSLTLRSGSPLHLVGLPHLRILILGEGFKDHPSGLLFLVLVFFACTNEA